MGVLAESWCFCKGVGKSERMKATIFTNKASAMARISDGTGFLIHRNLLLTTHANLPSVTSAESSEIRLQNGVAAALVPHRYTTNFTTFFISVEVAGCDWFMIKVMSVMLPCENYVPLRCREENC